MGSRADAPTDGVVWEVSKQAIPYPDLDEADPRQVTSMEWEFHVADGVENLHAFIYNVLDKQRMPPSLTSPWRTV